VSGIGLGLGLVFGLVLGLVSLSDKGDRANSGPSVRPGDTA